MKNVILIGDSIRIGYQEIVRRELAAVAHVWAPDENGGNSRNVLSHLEDWAILRRPDLVHINCGLHDLRRTFGHSEAAVPIEEYTSNVRTILTRLRLRTKAVVIWAATTPVNERWHHERKGFDRFENDVNCYNAASVRVAKELNVPVDDLFTVGRDAARDGLLSQDGVHFAAEGYTRLGKAVAEFIQHHLRDSQASVDANRRQQ